MTYASQHHFLLSLLLLFASGFLFVGCSEDDEPEGITYDIPTSYADIENVSYSGQTERLNMLAEMKSYMSTANSGAALDASKLRAMYANEAGADFSQAYGKNIRSKTFPAYAAAFEAYIDNISLNSQSTEVATPGTAGIVTSPDGEKAYLVDEKGMEWLQIIEKGLMGACFYWQGTSVYLGADRMNVDNELVEPSEGTEMEHHWDEAFGYFGVPENFPSDIDGVRFWGDYCNDRNLDLETNVIMEAFLRGRAAISNKDLDTRDEAIEDVREEWEFVVAGTAIHYLNVAEANPNDAARRLHALSEFVAFAWSLQFNEARKMTLAELDELFINSIGTATINDMNLYNVTDAQIATARQVLAQAYAFNIDFAAQL